MKTDEMSAEYFASDPDSVVTLYDYRERPHRRINVELLADYFARHREAATEQFIAELARQSTEAWMRGDLNTADRLARLAGLAVIPSEHEAQG